MNKRKVLQLVPYIPVWYLVNKLSCFYRTMDVPQKDKILHLFLNWKEAFVTILPSFDWRDSLIGLAGVFALWGVIQVKKQDRKQFRNGKEYGSARWGTPADIQPFIDPIFENNLLLSETERMTMKGRTGSIKTARNKNVMVIGGSGSGKSYTYVLGNLMQMHSSYVVTDPKGGLLLQTGHMLSSAGYKLVILNLIDFTKSMHYNPFAYIHSDKDILKLTNAIIANTKGEGEKSGEDFWVKAERLLYQALIGYIHYEGLEEEKNFNTLLAMINASQTSEDDEEYKNQVDLMFEALEKKSPDHFAVRQYKKYKLAAGKTAKSILISCGARLAPFDIQELRDLMAYDEMELSQIGDRKTATFIMVSDTDDTFNFVAALLYTQMFNTLCEKADTVYQGRLPVHVRCLLDEFANIGQIPKFEKLIATIRSREISASIILQTKSQLKALYKDQAETIEGNCDSLLFLGGKEKSTLKDISELLGKETIDLYNMSITKGNQESHGQNFQKTGRELMSQDELAVMDGGKCIVQIRGVRPFFSNKYDPKTHKQYSKLWDGGKRNQFDVDAYLRCRLKLKKDEEIEVIEIGDLSEKKT